MPSLQLSPIQLLHLLLLAIPCACPNSGWVRALLMWQP